MFYSMATSDVCRATVFGVRTDDNSHRYWVSSFYDIVYPVLNTVPCKIRQLLEPGRILLDTHVVLAMYNVSGIDCTFILSVFFLLRTFQLAV